MNIDPTNTPGPVALETRITALLESTIPDLWAVYRFGSAGTDHERADSDLDLGFLSKRAWDSLASWDLAQRIAQIAGCDVDLVDLRRATTVMAVQVIVKGERISCNDFDQCAAFEAHMLADYARLNEERKAILADVAKRERVHA